MIVLEKREEVIEQIRRAIARGDLNARVEVDDPNLTPEQEQAVLERFCKRYATTPFLLKTCAARAIVGFATASANRSTRIEGAEKVAGIDGGAIITSNHFSPIDNTVVRTLCHRYLHQPYLPVVSNTTNLAMGGLFGFLMNYADIIPLNTSPHYLRTRFEPMLDERLKAGKKVLMYPEQEMWFNYRKPRPCKRGAYLYAARAGVPIISCFVEIRDGGDPSHTDFAHVSYAMHVLDPIFPDPALSARENSFAMAQRDYRQKCAAYESIYGKPLVYSFEADDIAGWVPPQTDDAEWALDGAESAAQALAPELVGGRA